MSGNCFLLPSHKHYLFRYIHVWLFLIDARYVEFIPRWLYGAQKLKAKIEIKNMRVLLGLLSSARESIEAAVQGIFLFAKKKIT